MKRSAIILIVILVILLIVPAYSFLKWAFQPKQALNVLVIDKTVPDLEKTEHRSLFWILVHNRFVKKEGNKNYHFRKDYFGFMPQKPLRNKEYDISRVRLSDIINLAEQNDAIYVTDTYGVYFNDWYQGINRSRRSRMIYGGLNNSDYLLLKEMNDRNKLVIAEYNTLGPPTPPLERNKTEELFNISWAEWSGKYFYSLDTIRNPEFPKWILELYRNQYRRSWDYKNSGIVFVKNDNRVVVLENQNDLDFDAPYLITPEESMKKYEVPYKIAYSNWFDIIETERNDVISWFKIYPNEQGDSIMASNMIPKMFPAIVKSPGDKHYYYFAGDFAQNPIKMYSSYFEGFEKLNFINIRSDYRSTHNFFWKFYEPLMRNIFEDYRASSVVQE